MIIGLTGKRGAGKTTLADILVSEHGFEKLHAFGPGKAMVEAYYKHLGIDPQTAHRLVYGDLRDVPHRLIPGDHSSRTFMEEVGKFMGVDLGPEYTLGAEIARAKLTNPEGLFVIESVVYEAEYFSEIGGIIVKVSRPQNAGKIQGIYTDAAVENIKADINLDNSLEDPFETVRELLVILDRY